MRDRIAESKRVVEGVYGDAVVKETAGVVNAMRDEMAVTLRAGRDTF